jgi:hypothetical protein
MQFIPASTQAPCRHEGVGLAHGFCASQMPAAEHWNGVSGPDVEQARSPAWQGNAGPTTARSGGALVQSAPEHTAGPKPAPAGESVEAAAPAEPLEPLEPPCPDCAVFISTASSGERESTEHPRAKSNAAALTRPPFQRCSEPSMASQTRA